MGCDVCIGTGEYDAPAFYVSEMRVSRKLRHCLECGGSIVPGDKYENVTAKWGKVPSRVVTCAECAEIRNVFSCGEGFIHGELWESMREYAFEHLTTASECFAELSATSKARVLKEWRKWKGLE